MKKFIITEEEKNRIRGLYEQFDDFDKGLSSELDKVLTSPNGWTKKEYADKYMWFKPLSSFVSTNCTDAQMVIVLGDDYFLPYIDKLGVREFNESLTDVYPDYKNNKLSGVSTSSFNTSNSITNYYNSYFVNSTPFKMWPNQASATFRCNTTTNTQPSTDVETN